MLFAGCGVARRFAALLAVLSLYGALSGGADGARTGSEQELSELESRIREDKADLARLRSEESSVLTMLENIDREFDARNAELEELNARIKALVGEVEATAADASAVEARLEQGKESFSQRARALYKWQRWGSPFVLLTGDVSVLELMRRKRLLEAVLDHDRKLIDGLARRTAELGRLERDLEQQRTVLQQERSKIVTLKAAIRREQERKRATLYAIQREAKLRTQALDELERASREIQALIERSTETVRKAKAVEELPARETPAPPAAGAPEWNGFANGKGQLDLPVRGRIIGGYGLREHPDLKVRVERKGLDIAALEGEEIRAVDRGKVIFASRLSGYGRMVILDHGERYYTVYAHLSKLYKEVGDQVRRGERIAAVGDSGTLGEPRLYFEVRKDGRPVDPAPWFKDGVLRAARRDGG